MAPVTGVPAVSEDDDESAETGGADPDDAPLDDMVREVREKQAAREAADEVDLDPADDPFESVEVPELDEKAVWAAFDDDAEREARTEVGVGAESEVTSDDDEEAVVPKRKFCQRCPHFADPPETACTHEGTTILEVVDADHLRVRNCPVAAEERDAAPLE